MLKTSNRRGLGLGAIVALLSSLFVAAPAATADETGVVIEPYSGTSYTMLITEPFTLKTRLGSSVDSDRVSKLRYVIEKPSDSYLVSYSANIGVPADVLVGLGNTSSAQIEAATTMSTLASTNSSTVSPNTLTIQVFSTSGALDSSSPAVDIKVTAFLDLDASGTLTPSDPREVVTVSFKPWSVLGATTALTAGTTAGATNLVGVATIPGPVNWDQLNNTFALSLRSTNDAEITNDSQSAAVGAPTVAVSSTAVSHSESVSAAVAATTMSAVLYYGTVTVSAISSAVSARTIDKVTVSGTAGDNLKVVTAATAEVRANAAFSFDVWPATGSSNAAVAVTPTMTITALSGLSNDEYIVIEGVKYTASANLPTVSPITLAAGKNTIDVSTYGFDGDEVATFSFAAQNYTATYQVDFKAADYNLENGDAVANTKPGTAVALDWTVEDQWGVASPLTTHQVVAYWVGDSKFSASASVSFSVVGGKVSVTSAAPSPATMTGSTTLRVTLQTKDVTLNNWTNDETEDVTIVVSSVANSFTGSNIVSVSASISYAIASDKYSWSATAMSGTTTNGGTSVVVTSKDLYFKDGTKTASGTITVRSDANGAFSFNAASAIAGTHSVTLAIGDVTTTSVVVISAATEDAGKTITFDKTEIYSGGSATITGTLVDANGNPVKTGSTASVAVTWTGKGLPFNYSSGMATDADGEFSFNVLVLAGETGQGAVSATYKPAGLATDEDNVTAVQAIDVLAEAPAAAADQKLNAGSYNGYVAVFAKGYKGSTLSWKIAGKWFRTTITEDYQVFQRKTAAIGATVKVELYINGVKPAAFTKTVTTR